MSSWLMKTAVQHVIGRLPKSYWWNGLFQKYVTKGYYPSQSSFEGKLSCCRSHYDHYLEFCPAPKTQFRALELGTGPWPIVPIGLYLLGAAEIWTYDLVPLLNKDMLKHIVEKYEKSYRTGIVEEYLGPIDPQRMSDLVELQKTIADETPAQLLRKLNIHVCIGDARSTDLQQSFFDLIFSTVVFEHIDAAILTDLLYEFRRLSSPDAIMSHYIGLADQYASFDTSITPYNFLQYSDRWWRILNNPLIPLSRLRIADFREIFRETEWEIVKEHNISGSREDLDKIRLAPEFQKYSPEDLLVLFSWLVAR